MVIGINSTWRLVRLNAEVGDKVRIKGGGSAGGARGELFALDGGKLVVLLEGSGLKVRVSAEQITNLSLAARKAWVTEPDRAVGRQGDKVVQ